VHDMLTRCVVLNAEPQIGKTGCYIYLLKLLLSQVTDAELKSHSVEATVPAQANIRDNLQTAIQNASDITPEMYDQIMRLLQSGGNRK